MKEKVLQILSSLILFIEGVVFIYGIFFTFSLYKSIPELAIKAIVFFVLAFFSYTKFHNRIVQWIAIILSLIFGFGGFLGLGWIFAIILAVVYIIGGKQKEPPVDTPPPVQTNSTVTPPEIPS